jgi:hypothetical protein
MTAVGKTPAELALRVAARNRAATTFARSDARISMARAADALNAVMRSGATSVRSDAGAGYVVHWGGEALRCTAVPIVEERPLPAFGTQACIDLFYVDGERIAGAAARAFAWASARWLDLQLLAQSATQGPAMKTPNSRNASSAQTAEPSTGAQIEADERHLAARKSLDAFTRRHESYFQMRDRRHPETGRLLIERNRALDDEQRRLFDAYVATNVAGHRADAEAVALEQSSLASRERLRS